MTDFERAARQSLGLVLQDLIAPARAGLDFGKTVEAQAAPLLNLTEGIQRRINEIGQLNSSIQSAIQTLEPYSDIPAVQPLLAYFRTLQPIVLAMSAAQTAQLALAALVVPDPTTVVAAAQYAVVKTLEESFSNAISSLIEFVEEGN